MRVILLSLVMMVSASAFASTSLVVNRGLIEVPESEDVSGSIIVGEGARDRFQSLMIKFNENVPGVSMYSDDLNMGRGENGDVVYETYRSVQQVFKNEKLVVSCEEHQFDIVSLVSGRADDYTDNYFCDVMPLK